MPNKGNTADRYAPADFFVGALTIMIRRMLAIPMTIGVMCAMSGCIYMSLHSYHSTRFTVRYIDTGQPAAMLPLNVVYWYDSYGIVYDLRKPKNISTQTDRNGEVVLDLADYTGGIDIMVGDYWFRTIKKNIVLNGGKIIGYGPRKEPGDSKGKIELLITPLSKIAQPVNQPDRELHQNK